VTGLTEQPPPAAAPSPEEREIAPEEGAGVSAARDSPPATAASTPERVLLPRWVQLVLLPLAIVGLWALAKAAGKVLVIFIIAALIALILNPLVAFFSRRLPRGFAVLLVYLVFFLTLAAIGLLLANPISNQVSSFSHNVPHLTRQANKTLMEFQHSLNRDGIHAKFIKPGETALQTLGDKVTKASSSLVSFGGSLLTEVASGLFDLVLIFVLSVYMLLYGKRIGELVRRFMPDGDGTPADDYPTLAQNALARYLGGQLLFSLIMGTTTGVAMYILGVIDIFPDGRSYAVVFGVFYGVMELVPYIGPILGALPAVLVALITHPISALWVTIVFIALQQLEGHIVAPQIFGHTLRINPLLVIFSLLLGLQVGGIIGALIALPILSVLRETAMYVHRHVALEPWSRDSNSLL
jgi:predicted PurR-regulated permease PerM